MQRKVLNKQIHSSIISCFLILLLWKDVGTSPSLTLSQLEGATQLGHAVAAADPVVSIIFSLNTTEKKHNKGTRPAMTADVGSGSAVCKDSRGRG